MKLFTKQIDEKLFSQYKYGNDLEKQVVVAKIFNPYGRGVWYLLNSDPNDPDYIWAIVDLLEVEVGSVSRSELESVKVPPFRLPLERDTSFTPLPATEVLKGSMAGKRYAEGGETESSENKEMLENQVSTILHHSKELSEVVKKAKEVEPWVITKIQRASTDLADVTHYLEGESKENYAFGGMTDEDEDEDDNEDAYLLSDVDGNVLEKPLHGQKAEDVTRFSSNPYLGMKFKTYEDAKAFEKKLREKGIEAKIEKAKRYASGGMMSHGGSTEDVNHLEGRYVRIYFLGVSEPKVGTIQKATISDPKYRHRYVRLQFSNGSEEAIPLKNYDDFLKGEKIELSDGEETYMLQLVKSKSSGGNMASGGMMYTENSIKERKDGNLSINYEDKNYIIGYSADGYSKPYGISFENEDQFRSLYKDKSAKKIWTKLEPIIEKWKSSKKASGGMMAKGGATFSDKVSAIKSRLKGTKVPARLKKDYGKRYNAEEAEMAAKRIAGAMRKK